MCINSSSSSGKEGGGRRRESQFPVFILFRQTQKSGSSNELSAPGALFSTIVFLLSYRHTGSGVYTALALAVVVVVVIQRVDAFVASCQLLGNQQKPTM